MEKPKNYITPLGFKRLTDEQDYLLKDERPKLCETIAWAAGNGDRSENADYIYGKKRLREIDGRLRFLASRIESAMVVDPEAIESEKVQFGATVLFENLDGEERQVSIVGIDETDSKRGLISWKAPLGKALLNKKVGDEVVFMTPAGESELTILELEYKKIDMEGFECK